MSSQERTVVEQTGFTPSEVSDFRSVFLAATNGEARMSLSEFKVGIKCQVRSVRLGDDEPYLPHGRHLAVRFHSTFHLSKDKNSLTISSLWPLGP